MPSPQTYDPTAATPYTATPAPEIQQPMASPLPAGPAQANGFVKTSGAVATMADSILRGFMQGRAYHQASQVMKLKKQQDDLTTMNQMASQHLLQLHQSGADPNSPEYKQAKSAVDGAWAAQVQFWQSHVAPDQGSGKKSKLKQAEGGILGALQSKDPMQVSNAWLQMAQKVGPPVYSQIAQMSTPQAQAQRQLADTAAANTLTHEQATQTYYKYAGYTPEQMGALPPEEQQKYKQAQAIVGQGHGGRAGSAFDEQRGAIAQKIANDPSYQPTESEKLILAGGKSGGGAAPKVGTFGDFMVTGYGQHPTAQQYEAGRKLWAQAAASNTTGTHVVMVPQADGSTKAVTVETTTSHSFPGAPGAAAAPTSPPASAAPQDGAPAPAHPHHVILHHAGGSVVVGPTVGGHDKGAAFAGVEKDTATAYRKAQDDYDKDVAALNNPKAGLTPQQKAAQRGKLDRDLQARFRSIAAENSQRTRDLGGIPAEDAHAAPAQNNAASGGFKWEDHPVVQ